MGCFVDSMWNAVFDCRVLSAHQIGNYREDVYQSHFTLTSTLYIYDYEPGRMTYRGCSVWWVRKVLAFGFLLCSPSLLSKIHAQKCSSALTEEWPLITHSSSSSTYIMFHIRVSRWCPASRQPAAKRESAGSTFWISSDHMTSPPPKLA